MFVEQINGQNIKIKFDINEKQLLLGDILKITATGKTGVLVQVINISTIEKNPNFNMAESKILFTIDPSGKLINWQGNIPSRDFFIKKLTAEEVLLCSNTLNPQSPVPLGTLSLYLDTEINVETSFFEKPTVIYCDKQFQKDNILNVLSCELSKNNEKTVLIDFNGEYSDLKVSLILEAGKNIKLPFDINGLELLYNKSLLGVSTETRAAVEDIFIEIEDYLASGEVDFIPFSSFRQAVDSVYETNKITELVLLKNKLAKFQKQGILADKKEEIISFNENIKTNDLIIIDLSKFPPNWQKELIEFIIDSNTLKYKQKFFLLIDSDKINSDKIFIEKLCGKANKNGISPIIITGHESENAVSLLSYATNIISFAPKNETKIASLKDHLIRLKDNEAVITGKITNNIPLYVNIYNPEVFEKNCYFNNSNLSENILPEIYLSQETEEQETEKTNDYNFNYSNQFDHNESEIELIDNISKMQEEVYISKKENLYAENYETYNAKDNSELEEEDIIYNTNSKNILDNKDAYNFSPESSSFYDAVENESHYHHNNNSSQKYASGFSENDLSNFLDDDETEYNQNSSLIDEEQGDENFDYNSNEEFQDESILDYASSTQEQLYESFYDDSEEENTNNYNLEEDFQEIPQQSSVKTKNSFMPEIPIYLTPKNQTESPFNEEFQEGDKVKHEKYGLGTVTKIIGSNEKKLCSIQFEDVGRRLLDPKLAGLQKI